MGKQAGRQSRSVRSPRRKASARQGRNTLGLRLLLLVALLILAGLLLARIPPDLLIAGEMAIFVLFLLLLATWLYVRSRPTAEERDAWRRQQMESTRLEQIAQSVGTRPLELQDLVYLGHDEFEHFTGALLETLGVLFKWERVGGAGDRGVDLRGQDQYERLFIVQCKHYSGSSITPRMTRELRGARQGQGADTAWFVTTSTFTKQAVEEVSSLIHLGHMALVDGQKLMEYIHEHWDALPEKWRWRLTECMMERDQQRREG
ncbi:MAG TPA: restriction endonuclease [Ktedonobacteraceae bacterium]